MWAKTLAKLQHILYAESIEKIDEHQEANDAECHMSSNDLDSHVHSMIGHVGFIPHCQASPPALAKQPMPSLSS